MTKSQRKTALIYLRPSSMQYHLVIYTHVVGCTNNGPLGMITGEIEDWQITASSNYPSEWDKACGVMYARPYLDNRLGWCARIKSSSEWLQIDLGVVTTVRFFCLGV